MPEAALVRPGRLAAVAAAALALWAGPATAQPESGSWQAVVSRQVHLRAGPGPTYPIVAVLVPGTPVEVRGCLPSYAWCDVQVDVRRGWVHGPYLEAYARDDHARLPDVGALLGIAIIGFALHEYWHDHYRERPWYGQRDRWMPPPAPPRPPGQAAPAPEREWRPQPGPGRPPGKGPEKRPDNRPDNRPEKRPDDRPDGRPDKGQERGPGKGAGPGPTPQPGPPPGPPGRP